MRRELAITPNESKKRIFFDSPKDTTGPRILPAETVNSESFAPENLPVVAGVELQAEKTYLNLESKLCDEYLLPYLNATDENLKETLLALEEKFNAREQTSDALSGAEAFLQGLFHHELYKVLKVEQGLFAVNYLPAEVNIATVDAVVLDEIKSHFSSKAELQIRLDKAIEYYRDSQQSAWYMNPSRRTSVDQHTGAIMLADLLNEKAYSVFHEEEKVQLLEESNRLYNQLIEYGDLEPGFKDELRLIFILRLINAEYGKHVDFRVEHGTPREDLRADKADMKIYAGNFSFIVQLKTLSNNEYLKEFNEKLIANAIEKGSLSTTVIQLATATIREAYRNQDRLSLKRLVKEFASALQKNNVAFLNEEYFMPQLELKSKTQKKVNMRTIEKDVIQYTNIKSLKSWGLSVEPTAEAISVAKKKLLEAMQRMLENEDISLTKEMISSPPSALAERLQEYL